MRRDHTSLEAAAFGILSALHMDRSPLLLAVVVALHLFDSWLLCRAWLRRGDDRFWGMVLGTFAQWGTLATVLSLGHALTPRGWLLGLTAITCAAILVARIRAPPGSTSAVDPVPHRPRAATIAGVAMLGLVVGAALVVQWRTPLHKGDDLMYHASRAAYWLDHRSLLPYPTHNDRQNVFPTSGDLPFLIGLLFTHDERIARMVHLAALPLALWGLLRLERVLGVRGPAALLGPLAFVTTPLVLASAEGIGAELWTALGLLGLLHCLVGVVRGGDGGHGAGRGGGRLGWFGLGAFAALGMSFKLTLLPVLALLPIALAVRAAPPVSRRALAGAGGLVAGVMASGLALTLITNTATYRHPLGPEAMRIIHTSDRGIRSLRVHAARVPFLLAGIPTFWSEALRQGFQHGANRLADRIGATTPLRWEQRAGWPGRFEVRVPPVDERFSLTALFGLGSAVWVVYHCWRRRRRGRAVLRWPPAWIVLVTGWSFLAVVLFLRWQAAAGLPDRFLVPFLAPAAALVSLAFWALRRRSVSVALTLLLVWGLNPGTLTLAERLGRVLAEPPRAPGRVGVFADAVAALPAGARVLLVSNQNSGDYVLFAPEQGFSNVVIPWGQQPFDRAALLDRIARDRPTHVLIEDRDHVDFHWGGKLSTREMVSAVAALPGARRIPLPDGAMRLFALDAPTTDRDERCRTNCAASDRSGAIA
jgi:hypothetical protein